MAREMLGVVKAAGSTAADRARMVDPGGINGAVGTAGLIAVGQRYRDALRADAIEGGARAGGPATRRFRLSNTAPRPWRDGVAFHASSRA